jgi:putative phosphoesterase
MKLLIASDLHGSYFATQFLIKELLNEKYDKLILLGDILYHGPRNPLPESYDPQKCYELLAQYKTSIIWIKGNCDSEVDEFVLEKKALEEVFLEFNDYTLHLIHGQQFDPYNYIPKENEIFLFGHYHLPLLEKKEQGIIGNPGSMGLPKNNLEPSYMVIDDKMMFISAISGKILGKISL